MSMLKRALMAMALILFADQAYAETGNELYERCKEWRNPTSQNHFDSGACLGYAKGIFEASIFYANLLADDDDYGSCVEPFVKEGERTTPAGILDIIINYLRDNPEKRGKYDSYDLSIIALIEAFPCPKGK